jgi:hypothetical protein
VRSRTCIRWFLGGFGIGIALDFAGTAAQVMTSESEADAKLTHENVAQLRAGKIPEGLLPGQVKFLRSLDLDPKVTHEFRTYRRGLIQDGEERAGVRLELAMAFLRRLVDYHEQLATKYDRARRRPWLPVEPDPLVPK